jgi:uncharacterized protein with GYD domain
MPVYVSVLKSTPEGNKDIKKARERFDLGKKNVESFGGKILAAYYVSARSEYLIVTEFPTEDARVKSMVNTLKHGTVTYEVFKALPVEEYFKLVEAS